MKILIIEDEQISADRLSRMLRGEHEIAAVMASNGDVNDYFAAGNGSDIDLILSDIQLGDGLSFESLRNVPGSIPVIFTTAYDKYAIQAFRFNSIDYLLKPIDADELHAALQRVKPQTHCTTDDIAQLLLSVRSSSVHYRERFLIPCRADEYMVIPVGDVSHISIRDGVVRLCTMSGKHYTLSMSLEEVESQLDPQRFMRVNRQYIISALAVSKLSHYFLGKMRVHMTAAPNEEIVVSKDKVAAVKRWLDS